MPPKRTESKQANRAAKDVRVLWSTTDWAQAVAELPRTLPLPDATVIVPNERAAHALRRGLLRLGAGDRLAGTRFVSPFTAARETLAAAGVEFSTGEETLRPLRIRRLLGEVPKLRHFQTNRLRDVPGWDEAFARTIIELEGAGWTPQELARSGDKRATDLALIWSEIDAAAGNSWTAARVLREATTRLSESCPLRGPVLAAVTGHESAIHAAFLLALPHLTPAVFGVRPLRESHLHRTRTLFGDVVASALRDAEPPRTASTDHERLAANLFQPPEITAQTTRPKTLDKTVSLEQYSGIEDELEAAADWVMAEVLEHRTPLEEVAVLLPSIDPLAGFLVDRLARLPWKDGTLPVVVQGGLPATGSGAGARILAILRALAEYLPADRVAALLPWLRLEGEDGHLSLSEAGDLAYSLGTLGGSVANPGGSQDWTKRLAAREAALDKRSGEDADDEHRQDRRRRERLLKHLRGVRPALEALVELAARVVRGDRLADLVEPLAAFLERHVRLLVVGDVSVSRLLARSVREACVADTVAELRGADAVGFVLSTLEALRLGGGRFGDPAVYVGTIAGAAPLPFRAVRVLGLAEGHFPAADRGDPILDEDRRRVLGKDVTEPPDRALTQLHAFYRVARNTTERLVLSAPKTDVNGTEREPSALLVDVASAVAPDDEEVESKGGIVGLKEIERLWFAPARASRRARRLDQPLAPTAEQDRVAAAMSTPASPSAGKKGGALLVPTGWTEHPALDLPRLLALEAQLGAGPMAGLFAPKALLPVVPGTTKDAPLSPTGVHTLFECPHRFLLEKLLGWDEPWSPPTGVDIAALRFGSLFHSVAEAFGREHGADFGARKGNPQHWKGVIGNLANRLFDALIEEYPLAGPDVVQQQRRRLLAAATAFVDYDWNQGEPRKLFDVERAFGYPKTNGKPDPFELKLGSHPLCLRGRIDRIDVEGRTTLLRDLKTGKTHARTGRDQGPKTKLDVQIAIYGLVAERLAKEWKVPSRVEVAYAYVERHPARERAFREDWSELREAALGWLDIAARLLAERAFPRSPMPKDCEYCPFAVTCGEAAPGERMAAGVPPDGAAKDYHLLRAGEA